MDTFDGSVFWFWLLRESFLISDERRARRDCCSEILSGEISVAVWKK